MYSLNANLRTLFAKHVHTKNLFTLKNIFPFLPKYILKAIFFQVVVDLFAGIGYFTLPYLVHAGAHHVHACEWNPAAVEALKKNLKVLRVI
jgi:16S rRNA G966 N2-methylase RsmD